jgi:hypothetical protein
VSLDPQRVAAALLSIISEIDYDLHKEIECDGETGEDHYPFLAKWFIRLYDEVDG